MVLLMSLSLLLSLLPLPCNAVQRSATPACTCAQRTIFGPCGVTIFNSSTLTHPARRGQSKFSRGQGKKTCLAQNASMCNDGYKDPRSAMSHAIDRICCRLCGDSSEIVGLLSAPQRIGCDWRRGKCVDTTLDRQICGHQTTRGDCAIARCGRCRCRCHCRCRC